MEWIEKYDASAGGSSWKFFDMIIDRCNLLWIKIFLNFPDFS